MAADADGQVDVIGHILDHHSLEVPFINAHHVFDGHIELPHFEIFGIDMSITRHVVMMWIASALLVLTMVSCFRRPSLVPTGLANFLETIIVFLRDEVIMPVMGPSGKTYMPFLLTIFFFILYCNMLGMVPYTATATGNISVTAALALISFTVTQGAGMVNNGFFGHWKNLVPSGLPAPLLIILIPIEIISYLSRPISLSVRLFANMMAGHTLMKVFGGFVVQMKWFGILPLTFLVALTGLEMLIAFLQAYVFAILTCLYINDALHMH